MLISPIRCKSDETSISSKQHLDDCDLDRSIEAKFDAYHFNICQANRNVE